MIYPTLAWKPYPDFACSHLTNILNLSIFETIPGLLVKVSHTTVL